MVTAGLGSYKWQLAGRRLARQANRSHLFSTVEAYDLVSLRRYIPEFYDEHGQFISENARGYGYWLWRPYLLLKKIKSLKEDEMIVFLDAGCELNINFESERRFLDYVKIAKDSGICIMRTSYLLTSWCKQDTLNSLSIRSDSSIRTVEPGVLFLTKSDVNTELMEQWIYWSTKSNYHHLDDSPSKAPNGLNFVEHRHDQSLLTALLADRPDSTIEQESFFPDDSWRTAGANFPIWVTRNHHPFLHESGHSTSVIYRSLRKVLRGH